MEEIHPKSKGEDVIKEIEKKEEKPLKLLNIEEIQKPSKGQKLIDRIKESDLINKSANVKGGKAVPMDRHGLPIPKNRKNWDMI